MPIKIEHEGELKTFYTQDEVDSEVAGLKVTLGQFKDEKKALEDKNKQLDAEKLNAEEAAATAKGDKDELQRIADQRDAKSREELDSLKNSIRSEKSANLLNDVVTELGAGGSHNEDLRDLLKARFNFDYDMDKHEYIVSGDNVLNIDDLKKVVKESGRYDAYLSGSGSTGGDSQGSKGAGATVVNPFKTETLNLTEQARILRDDPALAAQLKANA